jgi:hypothetical protein
MNAVCPRPNTKQQLLDKSPLWLVGKGDAGDEAGAEFNQ